MRKFLIAVIYLSLVFSVAQKPSQQAILSQKITAGGGLNGFSIQKIIDIDPLQVAGASDLTDFPVLYSRTDAAAKTVANGGSVTDTEGDDIVFTSDAGCATNLKYEREFYAPTTGNRIYHIKIPTLSTSVATRFYECIGKSSITTFQGDPTNVWTNNYVGVWHLGDGSTLSNTNSVTGTNGTTTGATATTGNIDGGGLFGGASTDKIVTDIGTNNTTRTYSIWSNRNGVGGGSAGRMAAKGTANATEYLSYVDGSGSYDYSKFWTTSGASWSITAPSSGAYHYFVVTYDNSSTANDPLMYLDGTSRTVTENGTGPVGSPNNNSEAWVIGNRGTDNARNWDGSLDEFRISNVIRTVDWILTEYNNQSSPSTFYTVI